jgi:glutaminyl-tRNA synthetase
VLSDCRVEASLVAASSEQRFQFERTGYFCLDAVEASQERLIFNRTVTLRDGWVKE